jgi:signal peptidase II
LLDKLFEKNPLFKPVFFIISAVLIFDQITKIIARIYLRPLYSVQILGDFFRLTYVENPGIAFGLRINNKVFFTVLSIIAVFIIFYYLFLMKENPLLRFSFAMILGGAFGNLIDRFLFGRVVDFLDFDFFDVSIPQFSFLFFNFSGYQMARWPVFNIADIAVTIGMILIIYNAIFFKEPQKILQADDSPQNN